MKYIRLFQSKADLLAEECLDTPLIVSYADDTDVIFVKDTSTHQITFTVDDASTIQPTEYVAASITIKYIE